MEIVECIKDDGYHELALKYIKNFPIKGEKYTIRKRKHTTNGLGYLLEEIHNPITTGGFEPSFSSKRFKQIGDTSNESLELEKTNIFSI